MPTLNAGSNVTLSIADNGSVTVQSRSHVLIEAVSGLGRAAGKIEQFDGMRTFGPFSPGGQLKLTASSAAPAQYEVAVGAPKYSPVVSSANSITAFAGGGQANAILLQASVNRVTTVATIGDSVAIPPALPGAQLVVINAAANSMNLFPSAGDAINALGANAAYAIAGAKTVMLVCAVAGTWNALLSA